MGSPTITDVAARAGVSKATVSAVLNDSDSVRHSTRAKVMDAVAALNYRPRSSARRSTNSVDGRSIGLIIKEFDNPYFADVISGVRAYANKKGYTVLVASSEGEYESEQRVVHVLKSKDVDGLIIFPVLDDQTDLSYLFELRRRNYPFVLLEEIQGVQASLVDVDNVEAFRVATKFLIDEGHRRVVHFAGPVYSTHSQRRIEGVRRAYSESSLVLTDDLIVHAGANLGDGYRSALKFFRDWEAGGEPSAVICFNDLVAMGVLRALAELGLRVPHDMSVVGCDDISLIDYLPTPLTTIRLPRVEKGRTAAEILIRQLEAGRKLSPEKVSLKGELVVRATTRSHH